MLFFFNGAIKEPASTPVTSGGVTLPMITQPIRIFLENYANVYVSSQGHWLCVHVWTLLSTSRMDKNSTGYGIIPHPQGAKWGLYTPNILC